MKTKYKEMVSGYLFILPALVLIITFSIVPILLSGYYSLTQFNVVNPPVFIGLDNYRTMLNDISVSASLRNTIWFTVFKVPLQTVFALVIAALLAAKFRNLLGNFTKAVLFIPVISSAVLTGYIWSTLLATESGLINMIITSFGLPGVNWLGQPATARIGVLMAAIWRDLGYFMVIFYAGIMEIPKTLYEAAEVDGASRTQQFFYITLPLLKPVTYLIVILGTIWAFQMFDLPFTMTGGGPGRATLTMVYLVYNSAFRFFTMGYASAVAMLLFFVILIISAIQRFAMRYATD